MTNRKEKLIELLRGSISTWDTLPEEILKEDIYDETGHVDLDFLTAILEFMSHQAEVAAAVQKALNHLLGCDDDAPVQKKADNGEKWPVEKILQNCKWNGQILTLPPIQFSKKAYLEAKKWIEETGGRWDASRQGFTWEFDPTRVLGILLQGKRYNLQQEFQYFATPDWLADLAVSRFSSLSSDMKILEPSAGRGALVKAIRRRCPEAWVECYELMPENIPFLEDVAGALVIGSDFHGCQGKYQRIIANPPFSRNQDIDHVYMMFDHLEPGGEMSVITSRHWRVSDEKKCQFFRQWLTANGATIEDISAGEFKESGTMIPSSLVFISKK